MTPEEKEILTKKLERYGTKTQVDNTVTRIGEKNSWADFIDEYPYGTHIIPQSIRDILVPDYYSHDEAPTETKSRTKSRTKLRTKPLNISDILHPAIRRVLYATRGLHDEAPTETKPRTKPPPSTPPPPPPIYYEHPFEEARNFGKTEEQLLKEFNDSVEANKKYRPVEKVSEKYGLNFLREESESREVRDFYDPATTTTIYIPHYIYEDQHGNEFKSTKPLHEIYTTTEPDLYVNKQHGKVKLDKGDLPTSGGNRKSRRNKKSKKVKKSKSKKSHRKSNRRRRA